MAAVKPAGKVTRHASQTPPDTVATLKAWRPTHGAVPFPPAIPPAPPGQSQAKWRHSWTNGASASELARRAVLGGGWTQPEQPEQGRPSAVVEGDEADGDRSPTSSESSKSTTESDVAQEAAGGQAPSQAATQPAPLPRRGSVKQLASMFDETDLVSRALSSKNLYGAGRYRSASRQWEGPPEVAANFNCAEQQHLMWMRAAFSKDGAQVRVTHWSLAAEPSTH